MSATDYRYYAKVLRVIDGDTIDAEVDCGFRIKHKARFRFARINAPEVYGEEKEAGLKAKAYLDALIGGRTVIIESSKDPRGGFGRWLGEIYLIPRVTLDDDEEGTIQTTLENVNDMMVEAGHALPSER